LFDKATYPFISLLC